jgi:hypothetical protein
LTSSKGALPTQTTAPLAPPASKLVTATSFAEFPLNIPSFKSTHGASTSLSFPFRDEVEVVGEEFKIRLVEVYIVNEIVRTIDIVISGSLLLVDDLDIIHHGEGDIRETTP